MTSSKASQNRSKCPVRIVFQYFFGLVQNWPIHYGNTTTVGHFWRPPSGIQTSRTTSRTQAGDHTIPEEYSLPPHHTTGESDQPIPPGGFPAITAYPLRGSLMILIGWARRVTSYAGDPFMFRIHSSSPGHILGTLLRNLNPEKTIIKKKDLFSLPSLPG